ncbi:serine hydrolase [Kitasatospora sp. NPDC096147]|uniref:serine hydrolase n=1 Tax=Kitasatospora sp. NPDC096147 TaxID=3364093 RepID=UPI0037F8068A
MTDEMRHAFEAAGCEGSFCVRSLDGGGEVALAPDSPAAAASTAKVLIALEAETRFADGRLDPRERVTLRADDRTDGPTGVSLLADDVELSLRDLVPLMLTISDNPSTDELLRWIGTDTVNATAQRLGLTGTAVDADLRTLLDDVGRDLGRAGWADLQSWAATATPEQVAESDRLVPTVRALDPVHSPLRTTARDMTRLLELIWTDRAGPAEACARVRSVMARQLTRHRLGSGFRPPVRVAAKSGSLFGVVRNEVGVITLPDGHRYAAAVLTRSAPGADDAAISAAIGRVAALAVAALAGPA